MHLEMTARDGVAQIAFEGVAGFELRRHRLVVKRVAVAPRRFRAIEREVGLLQQLLLVVAVLRRDRDPDAGADLDAMARQLERFGDQFRRSARDRSNERGPLIVACGLDDREFVAAEPRQHVGARAASSAGDPPPAAAARRRPHDRASR